jgi:hypothetical protein
MLDRPSGRWTLRRYLVVGNQTLASERLAKKIHDALSAGPAHFHLVVPATPPQEHLTWTEGAARDIAERRLEAAVERFTAMGAGVDGEVGDASPMEAIRSVLKEQSFDEIILSTLPLRFSRWVKQDLPHRVHREFDLPISHVVEERRAKEA